MSRGCSIFWRQLKELPTKRDEHCSITSHNVLRYAMVNSPGGRVSIILLLCLAISFSSATASFAAAIQSPKEIQTMPKQPPPSIVYTIAGSDSGGGAGIQADLKAIHTISGGTCHGCSAVTCLTAQNSCGVTSVHSPPVEFLREQLSALEGDLYPQAVKVGMLGTKELAEEVGSWLRKLKDASNVPLVVVDPVMISTSGHKLIDETAKSAMIEKVFP